MKGPRGEWQSGRRRYARLIKVCRVRGCSREDAEELVQEAHLRCLQYMQSTRVRDPDTLLRRIVVNLSINHWHQNQISPFVSESIRALDRQGLLVDPTPGPERILAAEQELDIATDPLASLSTRTCQIFIAQRIGYSYEEIAAQFAVKPRTVEKHVAMAASALAEQPVEPPNSYRREHPSGDVWLFVEVPYC